ncbi:MAG: T9SS type A sorting domain-containing protein [Flavobacteriales bacterium]|nr:T9SS type A sorting domain-containing protein [Flavobacteriales bacterium]
MYRYLNELMKSNYFIPLFLLIAQVCEAQSVWYNSYGTEKDERGASIIKINDGGFVASGHGLTIRIDSLGDTLWTAPYGKYKVVATADKGFIVTDTLWDNYNNTELIKLDSIGQLVWSQHYPQWPNRLYDNGYNLIKAVDSGYAFVTTQSGLWTWHPTGETLSSVRGIFFKINALGDTLRTNWLGEGYMSNLAQAADGGYLLCGGSGVAKIIKLDSLGDKIWSKGFLGSYKAEFTDVKLTWDGGFILAGNTEKSDAIMDGYLVKVDAEGIAQWSHSYGGSDHDFFASVEICNDSGFIAIGSTRSGGLTDYDVYAVKTDKEGNIEWERSYGQWAQERGGNAKQLDDGSFIIVGSTNSYSQGDDNMFIIKTDESGYTEIPILSRNYNELNIHPVPARSVVYFNSRIWKKDAMVLIYNSLGQVLLQIKCADRDTNSIDIKHLTSGLYILSIRYGDEIESAKLIIE